jgi:hypothetical protein
MKLLGVIYLCLLGVGLVSEVLTPVMGASATSSTLTEVSSPPALQNPTLVPLPTTQNPVFVPQTTVAESPAIENSSDEINSTGQAAAPAMPQVYVTSCAARVVLSGIETARSSDVIFTVELTTTGCAGRLLRLSVWLKQADGSAVKSAGDDVYFRDLEGNLTTQTTLTASQAGTLSTRLRLPRNQIPTSLPASQVMAFVTLREESSGTLLATSGQAAFTVPR